MNTEFVPILATLLLLFNSMAGTQAATITVRTNSDSGPGSLRAALASAANDDAIAFAISLPATITLTSGELLVTKRVIILGPDSGNLTVDGNGAARVFHIAPSNTVSISGLTIANGLASGNLGGGILNDHATLTVNNCTFSGNSADFGGGILNDGHSGSATLKVRNSTFSGNSAGLGGGLYNYALSGSALLEIRNSTLGGNSAYVFGGGGVFNDGRSGAAPLKISNSTLSGNSAVNNGGGIYNYRGPSGSAILEIGNTILKPGASGQNLFNDLGTVTSRGYNLSSDGTGPNNGSTDRLNTDPLLGPLQNNGGPTLTHALLPGSPAIDKGTSDGLATDQRGRPRPADFPGVPNATAGDGSDIGAFEWQLPALALKPTLSGTNCLLRFDTEVGLRYRIVRKDAMTATSWTIVADNLAGTGSIVTVTNVGAASLPRYFYRGQVLP